MRVLRFFLMLFLASAAVRPASADDTGPSGWRVVQTVGAVSTVTTGMTPVAVNLHAELPLGTRIRTGDTGKAVLVRGKEQIILERNSEIVLDGERGIIMRVRQQLGTALFSIGKKRDPYFEVNTPYIAALVKGTTFMVRVSRGQSDVSVIEGAVQVASRDRSAVTLLTQGKTGTVKSARPKEIQIIRLGRVERRVTRNEGGWENVPAGESRFDMGVITLRKKPGKSHAAPSADYEDIALEIDDTGTLEHPGFTLSLGAKAPKFKMTGTLKVASGGGWGMVPESPDKPLSFKPAFQLLKATGRKTAGQKGDPLEDPRPDDPEPRGAGDAAASFDSVGVFKVAVGLLVLVAMVVGFLVLAASLRQRSAEAGKDNAAARQDRILGRR